MGQLEDLLRVHLEEQRAMRDTLTRFVARQAAILEAEVFEEYTGQAPPAGGGSVTDAFAAQTSNVEVITGLVVCVPVGTTAATLTLGEHVIPIQNTFTLLSPLQYKCLSQVRSLTYTAPANASQASYQCFWGYAVAASNAPGRLH